MKSFIKVFIYGFTILFLGSSCSTSQDKTSGVQENNKQPECSFSVISDIHMRSGLSDWGYLYEDQIAERKFARALKDLFKINPTQNALIVNGDLTTTGMQSDYNRMKKVLSENPHPSDIMFSIGNHEFYSAFYRHGKVSKNSFPNGISEAQCIQRFLDNTGMPNVYYDRWIEGYHFIFLGSEQSRITNTRNHDNAILSEPQLKWLDEQLSESPEHKPVFVFLHQPIPYTVAGSDQAYIVNAEILRRILTKYQQVIFFSGHSHRTLYSSTQTLFHDGFFMINDSSVRSPENRYGLSVGDSEGLYVQVYKDKVVVNGRDFTHKAWINHYTVPL